MITIRFVPWNEISNLGAKEKIKYLLNFVSNNRIVILEGRLSALEEAELIKTTMRLINKKFKGVELAVFNPSSLYSGIEKIKHDLVKFLLGKQLGLTLIGPANLIKAIKKEPSQLTLLTKK